MKNQTKIEFEWKRKTNTNSTQKLFGAIKDVYSKASLEAKNNFTAHKLPRDNEEYETKKAEALVFLQRSQMALK